MYRSNARQTGANEAPLAAQRRWGGGGPGGPPPPDGGPGRGDDYGSGGYGGQNGGSHGRDDYGRGPQQQQQRDSYGGYDDRGRPSSSSRFDDRGGGGPPAFDDRGRPMGGAPGHGYGHGPGGPMQPPPPPPPLGSESPAPSGERKRKSRWGDKQEGAMPVAITGGVQEKDLESYARTCASSSPPANSCVVDPFSSLAVNLRLDEIGRSLKTGNVVPPDHLRSPSPPPTYDAHGRRTNTREVRYRKKLEDERMRLVERQIKLDPNYRAPAEYLMAKRQNSGRPTDKVYIPVKEFPEINFFGLLVGPRGNSLKKMERESGARISIRGKGSVKEGKGKPGHREEDETDELHCLITADSEEKVQACVKLINSVIETVRIDLFPVLWCRPGTRRLILLLLYSCRPHRFRKGRTTTNGTSCVNSPRSTVPSVTTRTRSASESSRLPRFSWQSVNSSRPSSDHPQELRWPGTSQVRLPGAKELERQHHLPNLWWR
jgi:splicing factor 1